MNSERAALAKSLLAKKGGGVTSQVKGPLPTKQGRAPTIQQPDYKKYSNIHPEVLQHVTRFLDDFKKGLGSNGR